MTILQAILQIGGQIFTVLGIWLFLCDRNNPFAGFCLCADLFGLIVGGLIEWVTT